MLGACWALRALEKLAIIQWPSGETSSVENPASVMDAEHLKNLVQSSLENLAQLFPSGNTAQLQHQEQSSCVCGKLAAHAGPSPREWELSVNTDCG